MDILVGKIPAIGPANDRKADDAVGIEARLLHVRPARGNRVPAVEAKEDKRRREAKHPDPPGSRVLVLLVPDSHRLPEDINDGRYRIFLRVVKK